MKEAVNGMINKVKIVKYFSYHNEMTLKLKEAYNKLKDNTIYKKTTK